MLRKLLLSLGAVAALLVLAVVALYVFVDVNAFKPRIEQEVSSRLQRTLRIDGDLKLTVFPRIGVVLPKTMLSQYGSQQPFARLDGARVSVTLLPLLQGRFEADRIRISGLAATIERRKDGTTNIDDLLGNGTAKQSAPAPGSATTVPQFDVGGIELVDAQLGLVGPAGPLLQLSKLSLTTGRLRPKMQTKVTLAADFAAAPAKAQGRLEVNGELDVDLPARRFGVRELAITSKGKLDAGGYELSLATPQLALGETVQAEKIQVKAKLGGAQRVDAELNLSGVSGTAKDVAIKALQLTAALQQGERKINARLGGPVEVAIEPQQVRLPQLAGEVTVDDPALPQKTVKLPIAGSASLGAEKQAASVRLETKFDDTQLDLRADVDGFDKPRVRFEVAGDRIDLDRYLPPQAPAAAPTGADGTEAKVDLSPLRGLNLSGQVRLGALQARGLKVSDLRVGIKAAGGRLDAAPLAAKLYGGALSGAAFAVADGNRAGLKADLNGISIDPLLRDALKRELLEGTGQVRLDVTSNGATVSAMKRTLDGTAALRLRDGAIKGINLAQKFRDAKAMITGGKAQSAQADMTQKTDFSELSASFVIKDGVATSDDLDARSPLLRLGGKGRVDVGAGKLDYTANVSVVGTLKGQDGRDVSELRGVTVPVRLHGPFEQMSYAIDWAGLAREALKSKATEEIKKKITPQVEQQRQQIKEKGLDALKGLFGK
jgi:AsmA protein